MALKLDKIPESGTVCVACKLPTGLVLDLPVDVKNPAAGSVPFATVRGFSQHYNNFSPDVVGGYGITRGVDAQKFAEWMRVMANYGPVTADLIFACENPDDTVARAKDQSEVKSGLEPMDPSKEKQVQPFNPNA